MTPEPCPNLQHDYDNAVRKGRAHYVCPKCGQDITLMLVLLEDAKQGEIKAALAQPGEKG